MNYTTYILYSEERSRYYTGSTGDSMEKRLRKHNYVHTGFTGSVSDWEVVFSQEFPTIQESRQLEKKIKKRGARRFLNGL